MNLWRLLIVVGVLWPVVDLPVVYSLGALQPNYDRTRQFISELGESGRPYAGLANAWFIVSSVVLAGFGVGMAALLPPLCASTAGILLYMAWAGCAVVGGFFPCDPGCAGETWSGWTHLLLGQIGGVCIVPVPLLVWLGVYRDPRWSGFGWLVFPIQVSLLVVSLAFGVSVYNPQAVGGVLQDSAGLLQWLCWCVYYAWVIALGVKLLRVGRIDAAEPGAAADRRRM